MTSPVTNATNETNPAIKPAKVSKENSINIIGKHIMRVTIVPDILTILMVFIVLSFRYLTNSTGGGYSDFALTAMFSGLNSAVNHG
jgi:hypothetical protein